MDGRFSNQSGCQQKQQHGSAEGYKMRRTYEGHRYCFFFPFPFLEDFSFEHASSTHKDMKMKKETANENFILKVEVSAAQSTRENRKTFILKKPVICLGLLFKELLNGYPTGKRICISNPTSGSI